jgi:hypothetical protein
MHPVTPFLQLHAKIYPTLAKIALDVLPAQASSVPCERLFSGGKEIAVARRVQLGSERFEQLQVLKFAWRKDLVDHAGWNSEQVEEFEMDEYKEMLMADVDAGEWDTDTDMEADNA